MLNNRRFFPRTIQFIAILGSLHLVQGCISGQSMAESAIASSYCPDQFGSADPEKRRFNIYLDEEDRNFVFIKTHSGSVIRVELEATSYFHTRERRELFWNTDANTENSKSQRFLGVYAQVCGRFPPYLLATDNFRSIREELGELVSNAENAKSRIDSRRSRIALIRQELDSIPEDKTISQEGIVLYLIAGRIVDQANGAVAVYGNAIAVSGASNSLENASVDTTFIVLQPLPDDIVGNSTFYGNSYVYLGIRNGRPTYASSGNGASKEKIAEIVKRNSIVQKRTELLSKLEIERTGCEEDLKSLEKYRSESVARCRVGADAKTFGPLSGPCDEVTTVLKESPTCN